ncbi:MAG TPA: hypothetical protein VM223_11490 [Planctomycetota bacterium]|nr:hypothetical protein [Planctomycetota bacterium]
MMNEDRRISIFGVSEARLRSSCEGSALHNEPGNVHQPSAFIIHHSAFIILRIGGNADPHGALREEMMNDE